MTGLCPGDNLTALPAVCELMDEFIRKGYKLPAYARWIERVATHVDLIGAAPSMPLATIEDSVTAVQNESAGRSRVACRWLLAAAQEEI